MIYINELHISYKIRKLLKINDSLLELHNYSHIVLNWQNITNVTHAYNTHIAKEQNLPLLNSAHIFTMGLIDEIYHIIINYYRQYYGNFMPDLRNYLIQNFGKDTYNKIFTTFLKEFPYSSHSSSILQDNTSIENEYLLIEEILILYLENQNPIFCKLAKPFFDDETLSKQTKYFQFITAIIHMLDAYPAIIRPNKTTEHLIASLIEPYRTHPMNLEAQLQLLYTIWGSELRHLAHLIKTAQSALHELSTEYFLAQQCAPNYQGVTDMKGFLHNSGEHGSLSTQVQPDRLYHNEYTAFTDDNSWMPKVVMIAKNIFVWLAQLSHTYQTSITTINNIPDTELQRLQSLGITALWLIGIWERSPASQKIKQLCGNNDALASAYSLIGYSIAEQLGGWDALTQLRIRASAYGISLASDMVPNHTGITSEWIYDNPDWFVQVDHPPYPNYHYSGFNLSERSDIGIYIENNYYSKTDAAVTFKHVNFETGQERYIYHGNDGTSMPWNDTAQINFLNADAREAVIQNILHVARNFPIIRFDAAMVLTRKHYRRLWYPAPGHTDCIPSRNRYGVMEAEEFSQYMEHEFWREVVNRIQQEVPDTLLLAEAFWLLEGYFVKTLGMHRVYNSAFMNMLRDEKNNEYHTVLCETMDTNPQILKRYVNFMSNPDEETAIYQFGAGDKYLGVCTMMITLPGLPLFGHGQFEGFHEKYGMEYARPMYNESVNELLLEAHQHHIIPLLKKRYVFAEVVNFHLYAVTHYDHTICDIFAYSNSAHNETFLILYNNSIHQYTGIIHHTIQTAHKPTYSFAHIMSPTISEQHFILLHDTIRNIHYLRKSTELEQNGLFIMLAGYQTQVFSIENVYDQHGGYQKLYDTYQHSPINDFSSQYYAHIQPIVTTIFKPYIMQYKKLWHDALQKKSIPSTAITEITEQYPLIHQQLQTIFRLDDITDISLYINYLSRIIPMLHICEEKKFYQYFTIPPFEHIHFIELISIVPYFNNNDYHNISQLLVHTAEHTDIFMGIAFLWKYIPHGLDQSSLSFTKANIIQFILDICNIPEIQVFLHINEYENVTWFNSEQLRIFLMAMFLVIILKNKPTPRQALTLFNCITNIYMYSLSSQYHWHNIIQFLEKNCITRTKTVTQKKDTDTKATASDTQKQKTTKESNKKTTTKKPTIK